MLWNSSLVLQSKISANGLWCGGGGGNGGRSRSDAGIGEDGTGTADAEMRERLKREREDNQTFPSHKDEGSWKRTSTMPENVMHYITSRVCWTLQGSQSTRQPPTTCTWCKNANDIGLMRALSLVGREVIMNNCVWLLSSPSERVWSQASPVTLKRKNRDMSLRLGLWATYYKYYQLVFSSLLLLTLWRHDCGYLLPAFCWFAYSLYWAWPTTPIEGLHIQIKFIWSKLWHISSQAPKTSMRSLSEPAFLALRWEEDWMKVDSSMSFWKSLLDSAGRGTITDTQGQPVILLPTYTGIYFYSQKEELT